MVAIIWSTRPVTWFQTFVHILDYEDEIPGLDFPFYFQLSLLNLRRYSQFYKLP